MDLKDFKPIEGLDDYYVDKDGNIVSIKIKVLKGSINEDGYRQYHISQNGKDKYITGHVAVAKAFLSNPNNLPVVNHKDGVKTNNKLKNLEWSTYSYNSYHSCHILGNKPPITCEKPIIAIDTVTGEILEFNSISEGSRYYNVDPVSIANKIKGKSQNPSMRKSKLKGIFFKFKESVES